MNHQSVSHGRARPDSPPPARVDAAPQIVTRSAAMQRLMNQVEIVGPSAVPVLINGETGTGKELIARALHFNSGHASGPVVAVNCAAIPETLIEVELFGCERGAYTGADRNRQGRFHAAQGGTLFLDEVGELPLMLQAKLLRVLQEHRFEPVGSSKSVETDARMVYATHRDLHQMVMSGHFREDLYYRMRVIELNVPPLRERPEDLPVLIDLFLREASAGTTPPTLSPEARQILLGHRYPGNVRELKHAITHGVVLAHGMGVVRPNHLPPDLLKRANAMAPAGSVALKSLAEVAAAAEREHILEALRMFNGRRGTVAQVLQISRKTLWEKIRSYGIPTETMADGRSRCVIPLRTETTPLSEMASNVAGRH